MQFSYIQFQCLFTSIPLQYTLFWLPAQNRTIFNLFSTYIQTTCAFGIPSSVIQYAFRVSRVVSKGSDRYCARLNVMRNPIKLDTCYVCFNCKNKSTVDPEGANCFHVGQGIYCFSQSCFKTNVGTRTPLLTVPGLIMYNTYFPSCFLHSATF